MSDSVNYTTINHQVRKTLGLSWLEYGMADLVFRLSNNPESQFPGWCYASKESLAENLGVSKQTVHTLIKNLVSKNLIDRNPTTKHLRITIDWYKTVEIGSKETLPPVKKLYSDSKETLLQDSKETLHKNINTENIKENTVSKLTGETGHGNADVNEILSYLKETLQLPELDGSQKLNRQYAWLLLKASKTGVDGVKWLIDQASADGWWRNRVTSTRDLWNNKVKIVSSKRGGMIHVES